MAGLTDKQARFVEEYLIDLNATQAAIRAGYSEKGAEVQGHQLLRNPKVSDAVQAAKLERSKRTEITADAVVKELARIGFSDIGDFLSFGKGGIKLMESNEVDTKCLAEVKQTATQFGPTISFKLHDKMGALDKLAKHLGIYAPEKQEISGPNGGPIEVSDAKQKLAERLARLNPVADPDSHGGDD